MKSQLIEGAGESQTPVDQEDNSTLLGITLKPYGIENIELGRPAGVLNTETGEVSVVSVGGVCINKAPEAVGVGIHSAFVGYPNDVIQSVTNLGCFVTTSSVVSESQSQSRIANRSGLTVNTTDISVTIPVHIEAIDNEASLKDALSKLIIRAKKANLVLSVDLVPNKPLTMSNYTMVPSIRKKLVR